MWEAALQRQIDDCLCLIRERLQTYVRISERAAELQQEREKWSANLRPQVKAVVGHLHGPLLQKLVAANGHCDMQYFS